MIERGFSLVLDDATTRRLLGKGADRVLKSGRNVRTIETAREELLELAEPAGAWRTAGVAGIKHDTLVLDDGSVIGGGPVVAVTCGASEIAVGVSTIGPGVERKTREYIEAGNTFHAFVLDAMASWAAGEVRTRLVAIVKDHYARRGYRTSIMLGPGESAWSVEGQRAVFALLGDEAAAIGLRLEPTLLMTPLKSTTFLLGAGPGPLGDEAGDPCTYCSLQDRCERRGMHG